MIKKLKEEIEKKGLKMSVTENGKEGKMIASCGFLEDELRQCSKEEGVTMTDSVETLGVDLRTRAKNLEAKEKARRKKCKVRFSLINKNKAFQKNYMKVGGQEVVASGYGASKDVESSCSVDGSEVEIEVADDSSEATSVRPLCPCSW